MKLLALESSAKAASCAVFEDGQVLASAWQSAGLTHSRTLLPMVEDMLRNSGCALRDVDGIAVAAGPGSFTGLRIGVASAKGLAWGAEKPCVPVSTLEAMAWPLAHLEGVTVCAMDARRQQIYVLWRNNLSCCWQLTSVLFCGGIQRESLAAKDMHSESTIRSVPVLYCR